MNLPTATFYFGYQLPASDNPAAAAITIELSIRRAVRRRGVRMRLKQCGRITDAACCDGEGRQRQPDPGAHPRRRARSQRREVHHQRSGGDMAEGIVTPAAIVTRIAIRTKMGSQTALTAPHHQRHPPGHHGTRTAINATLHENAAVSASIHYFAPLLTSPGRRRRPYVGIWRRR